MQISFEAQERVVAIVKTEALTLAGMSFQRTRYSLKKKETPSGLNKQTSRSIKAHLAREAAGKAHVLFGDESGFTENSPLTQAWAPKGQPHAHEMKAGTRARLNGIGCCDFNLKPISIWFKEGRVGGAGFTA